MNLSTFKVRKAWTDCAITLMLDCLEGTELNFQLKIFEAEIGAFFYYSAFLKI